MLNDLKGKFRANGTTYKVEMDKINDFFDDLASQASDSESAREEAKEKPEEVKGQIEEE